MTTRSGRAALLATAGLVGLGTALAGPASAATAPAAATVQLDGVPQVAALAGDHLWVLVAGDGSPALVEIDPATTRPTGRSVGLPSDVRTPYVPGGGQSPSSIRPSIAVADGDLFVAAAEGLLQVDPERAEIVRRLDFGARYVAAGAAGLWAIGTSFTPTQQANGRPGLLFPLARIDPASGTTDRTLLVGPGFGGLGPVELAVGEADLWISIPSSQRTLVRVNTATGAWTRWPGGAWQLTEHDGALYSVPRGGHVVEIRRGEAGRQVQIDVLGSRAFWRDLAVGPDGTAWGVLFRGQGRTGFLVRQPIEGLGSRMQVPRDPVGVAVGPSAAWVLSAADRTLTRVPVSALTPARSPVRLTATQLRINQRIAQAALRRINDVTARVDGVLLPEPAGGRQPRRVQVSAAQLLINQRISQAALRRANALAGRLEGVLPGDPAPPSGDTVALSARQLLISQRIAQAALRRVAELETRIPQTLGVPGLGPESPAYDSVIGVLETSNRAVMTVTQVVRRRGLGDGPPLSPGDRIPIVIPASFHAKPSFSAGSPIGAYGVVHGGVFFAIDLSIEPAPGDR